MTDGTCMERIGYSLAVLLCCLSSMSCVSTGGGKPKHDLTKDDLSVYRITNDQAGHDSVKTEQFLVPVGAVIVIKGLEFESGVSTLTPIQKRIVQEVFNCLEEITENTVGDTNSTRVAEYKKMTFEIRGCSHDSGDRKVDRALSEERAKAVLNMLTYLGTPRWRLKATGLLAKRTSTSTNAVQNLAQRGTVEFIRTR